MDSLSFSPFPNDYGCVDKKGEKPFQSLEEEVMNAEINVIQRALQESDKDAKEGIQAFLEKRTPVFKNC